MSCRISSTRHAVVRGPSLTGFGKRPDLTPSHHVERPTGMGPMGATMELSRRKPIRGRSWCVCCFAVVASSCLFIRFPVRPRDGARRGFRLEFVLGDA
jgi:hypothetical protein